MSGKAPVDPQKMVLGSCSGGAVRLGTPTDLLMVVETSDDGDLGHRDGRVGIDQNDVHGPSHRSLFDAVADPSINA